MSVHISLTMDQTQVYLMGISESHTNKDTSDENMSHYQFISSKLTLAHPANAWLHPV